MNEGNDVSHRVCHTSTWVWPDETKGEPKQEKIDISSKSHSKFNSQEFQLPEYIQECVVSKSKR